MPLHRTGWAQAMGPYTAPMESAQSLDAWQAAGSTFSAGSHRLFYRQEGAGPPLLLIHGFPTASWDWNRLWPALARRFRVVAMDMLGFGFSAKPRRHRYSIFEQADLHEALLAQLGVRRVHILAHDYGDTVAQELLARHAERRRGPEFSAPGRDGATRVEVASVCFLNGGLFPEAHHPRPIQKMLASPLGRAGVEVREPSRDSRPSSLRSSARPRGQTWRNSRISGDWSSMVAVRASATG